MIGSTYLAMAMIETKEKHTSSKSFNTDVVSMSGDWVEKVYGAVSFADGIKGSTSRTLAVLKISAKAKVTCMIKSYILQYLA